MHSIVTSAVLHLASSNSNSAEDLSELYDSELSRILDHHAPLAEKDIVLRPRAPWYTDSLRQAKRERRNAERQKGKSGLEVDKQIYNYQCKTYNKLLNQEKREYIMGKIYISTCNQQSLFHMIKTISSYSSRQVLPQRLAELFSLFLIRK